MNDKEIISKFIQVKQENDGIHILVCGISWPHPHEPVSSGLGQCIAEMVAAQRFNARSDNSFPIYGVVTTGAIWKFLRLEENNIWIDQEDYFIKEIGKLLGILSSPFQFYFSG